MQRLLILVSLALAAFAATIPAAPAATSPKLIKISVVNGRPVGGIERTTVKKGTVVRYVIRTTRGTEIHLHGYDLDRVVRKGTPTVLQFRAKLPGRFEVELHHPDVVIARLTVSP